MKTNFLRFSRQAGSVCAVTLVATLVSLPPVSFGAVGSWKKITNFPYSYPGHSLLLTDGTVLMQEDSGTNYYLLTPDSQGHYLNGTWSKVGAMRYAREYYSSQVLQNGNVFVAGGEYGDTNRGKTTEIYNSSSQSWKLVESSEAGLADAESILLQDGQVLVAPVGFYDGTANHTLRFNPSDNEWAVVATTNFNYQDECTWVKLPDETVLTVDIPAGGLTSQRYIPSQDAWILDADLKASVASSSWEVGGAFMLPDGRAFWLGGTGNTAYYTPSGNTNVGSWAKGPDMPSYDGTQYNWTGSNFTKTTYNGTLTAQDAPAAMMNNGKILCNLACNSCHTTTFFFEFDPTTGTFTPTGAPTNNTAGSLWIPENDISDDTFMLDLPDGAVLYADSVNAYIYTPSGSQLAAGQPTIQSVSWNSNGSLHLTGTLFNGISQGASYGDDQQQDSNYPLVRFTDSGGNVTYGKTYNWSDTGVQTGSRIVSTECTVPSGIYSSPSAYSLQVVANGIASDAVTFYSPVWVDYNYTGFFQFGEYSYPYITLAAATNAVASGGTIAFEASTQPSHTTTPMTLNTPMTIISVDGPTTIGK